MKNNLTCCRSWRCRKAISQSLGSYQCIFIKYWMQQFVKLFSFASFDYICFSYISLMIHIHSNLYHCCTSTFTISSLQDPQLSILNSKFQILHIFEVILQLLLSLYKLCCAIGQYLFKRWVFCSPCCLIHALQLCPSS